MCSSFKAHMLGAVLLACFWQQVAFYGHDTGHNGITHKRMLDLLIGIILGNTTGGVSLGWWKHSHNVHHIVCNSIENDPDIQHAPLFSVTEGIFGKFWSTFHQKYVATDWFMKQLVAHQHILFYPIMMLARFNLYIQSWVLLLGKEGKHNEYRMLEAATLLAF